MERYFKISKEAEYYKDLMDYSEKSKQQNDFINKFFKENNIVANEYTMGGDGRVNIPFSEDDKKEIHLSINPTEEDISNFSSMLCKPDGYGLCKFKKSSKIAKKFAQQCIDNQIIINLYKPRVGDYVFNSCLYRYSMEQFGCEDVIYLLLKYNYIEEKSVLSKGFTEIKASEYYDAKSKYEVGKEHKK